MDCLRLRKDYLRIICWVGFCGCACWILVKCSQHWLYVYSDYNVRLIIDWSWPSLQRIDFLRWRHFETLKHIDNASPNWWVACNDCGKASESEENCNNDASQLNSLNFWLTWSGGHDNQTSSSFLATFSFIVPLPTISLLIWFVMPLVLTWNECLALLRKWESVVQRTAPKL